jgi:hypothetical protein
MSELAETLRAWVEACKVFEDASTRRRETHDAVPEEYHYADRAKDYLRGYDDARSEMDPYIEKLERENEAMTARVKQLEADHQRETGVLRNRLASADSIARGHLSTIESLRNRVRELDAQRAAPPQPAAVGVMGYGITDGRLIGPWIDHTRERAEQRLRFSSSYTNVVAILNADIIAQPAQERGA